MPDRRRFLGVTARSGLALTAGASLLQMMQASARPRNLKHTGHQPQTGADQTPLPYAYDALEPLIDAKTMEIHYSKHAAAYAKNLKDALAAEKAEAGITMEKLLPSISRFSEKMRNNGGGHFNHEFFWRCMSPKPSPQPAGNLMQAMERDFNSVANFRQRFTEAAMGRFGSGWAWLYLDKQQKLQIGSTPNQDNPLMDVSPVRGTPLLGIDVWEHAYYLKYQNRRAEYVENWHKLIHWEVVAQRFDAAR